MTAHSPAHQLADAADLVAAIDQARRSGPPVVHGAVNNIDFEIAPDGALTMGPIGYGPAVRLPADQTYALYIWLAKYPHVGALLERLAAEGFAAYAVRIDQEDRATDRRNAERLADTIAAGTAGQPT